MFSICLIGSHCFVVVLFLYSHGIQWHNHVIIRFYTYIPNLNFLFFLEICVVWNVWVKTSRLSPRQFYQFLQTVVWQKVLLVYDHTDGWMNSYIVHLREPNFLHLDKCGKLIQPCKNVHGMEKVDNKWKLDSAEPLRSFEGKDPPPVTSKKAPELWSYSLNKPINYQMKVYVVSTINYRQCSSSKSTED